MALPKVVILAVVTPENDSYSTYRNILEDAGILSDQDLRIRDTCYKHYIVNGDSYLLFEDLEIGDIVFYKEVTNDNKRAIPINRLTPLKTDLTTWLNDICNNFNCNYEVYIIAL